MAQKLFLKNVTLQSEDIPNNRQVVVTLQEIKIYNCYVYIGSICLQYFYFFNHFFVCVSNVLIFSLKLWTMIYL